MNEHYESMFSVERLEMPELLRNPFVLELYNRCNHMSTTLIEITQQNNRLLEEISQLRRSGNPIQTPGASFDVSA